jgi:hypothetical protein
MGPRGRSPLTEAASGLRSVPINPPIVRSVAENPALRRRSPFFQLSATGPSVSESIPSGLALQFRRTACHAAALKSVPTKFLCRVNHPHLRGPRNLRIPVAPGAAWSEQENGRVAAPPKRDRRPRALGCCSLGGRNPPTLTRIKLNLKLGP